MSAHDRNKGRLGVPGEGVPESSSPAAATQAAVAEGNQFNLNFPSTTEFVELPSQGKYYPEGHPLKGVEEVEIRQMTAKDEDVLTNRDYIRKGVAIDMMLKNLLVDKTIDLDSILSGDKSAVLLAARRSGFSSYYDAKITCPSCTTPSQLEFDLSLCESDHGYDENTHAEVSYTESNTFVFSLPYGDIKVEARLLTSLDEREIFKKLNARKKKMENNVTESLKRIIVSVNENPSREAINFFVENCPSILMRSFRENYKKIIPSVIMSQVFVCPHCAHEEEVEPPIGVDFLYPQP